MKKALILIYLISLTLPLFSQKEGSFAVNISKPYALDSVRIQSIKFVYKNDKIALVPVDQNFERPLERIIFDNANNTMAILMIEDGKKMALLVNIPAIDNKWMEENNREGNPDVRIKSTSEIREINGKTAVKVEVQAKKMTTEIWVTNELDFDFIEIIKLLATDLTGRGNESKNLNVSTYGVGGFPLQLTVMDQEKKVQLEMTVTDISDKADASVFEMKGYKVEDMRK